MNKFRSIKSVCSIQHFPNMEVHVTTAATTERMLNAQEVRDHMAALRKLSKKAAKGRHQSLVGQLGIGDHLTALGDCHRSGTWLHTLEKVKIDYRTAQRLMFIAANAELRDAANISTIELPADLGALELLARLPADALQRALREWPLADLTATEIGKKVKRVLRGKSKKSPQPKAQGEQPDDADADSAGDDDDDSYRDILDDDDQLLAIVDHTDEVTDEDVDGAIAAIQFRDPDSKELRQATRALTACVGRLQKVLEAIAAWREAAVG
jgi:hypothetical protein